MTVTLPDKRNDLSQSREARKEVGFYSSSVLRTSFGFVFTKGRILRIEVYLTYDGCVAGPLNLSPLGQSCVWILFERSLFDSPIETCSGRFFMGVF